MASVREEDEVDELVQLMQQVNLTTHPKVLKTEKDVEGKDPSGYNVEGLDQLSDKDVDGINQSGDNAEGIDKSVDKNAQGINKSGDNDVEGIEQSGEVKDQSGDKVAEGKDKSGDQDGEGIDKSGDDLEVIHLSGDNVEGMHQSGDNTGNTKNDNYVVVILEDKGNLECCGSEEIKTNSDIKTFENGTGLHDDMSVDCVDTTKCNTTITVKQGCTKQSKNENNSVEENEDVCKCSDPVAKDIDQNAHDVKEHCVEETNIFNTD